MISTTIIGFKENIVIYLNVMHSLEMNKISTENKIPTAKNYSITAPLMRNSTKCSMDLGEKSSVKQA